MKTYRKALADAYALRETLECLAGRADDVMEDASRARERLKEVDDAEKQYYVDQVTEYEAKAAAFERLIEKLSK